MVSSCIRRSAPASLRASFFSRLAMVEGCVLSRAVLSAETFCTFVREFSPSSPVSAGNSGSELLGLRSVGLAKVAESTTVVMIDA